MSNHELPSVDDIDLSRIPDEWLGKFAIEQLLDGFAKIPPEKRADVLRQQIDNRAAFVETIRKSIFHDSHALVMKEPEKGSRQISDLDGTAMGIVSTIIDALSKVYPVQPSN